MTDNQLDNMNFSDFCAISIISLSFSISTVAVSLIVEKPIRREFLNFTISDLTGRFRGTTLTRSIEVVSG